MSEPLVLDVAAGPAPRASMAELAAALGAERWPMLLDSGDARTELASWHLLVFDPVERLQHRAGTGTHGFRELAAALARGEDRSAAPAHAEVQARGEMLARADGRSAAPSAPAGATRSGAKTPAAGALPAFRGGAVGWFGYELARELERVPARAAPDAELPDLCVGLYPFALAEELGTGRRVVVGRGSPADAARFLAAVQELQREARPLLPLQPAPAAARLTPASTFDRAAYMAAVQAVRERILDGDVYQVNLCQRLALPFDGDPAALQLAWRARFPAPFGALLRVPGISVVSSSPELFLRKRGPRVESRPIKGTAPRHADPAADAAARAALEASGKERAELAMIVDLVRNDLGRTARIGSVTVEGDFRTDAWASVYHRVATVAALVPPDTSALAVLEAAFPPASVTGAPKLAAQRVIESLEPVRRHVYTGAIGWIGFDGDMDLSVAIRIATLTGGRLLASFGGGITLASDPAAEYDETLHKARALCEVLGAHGPFTGTLP